MIDGWYWKFIGVGLIIYSMIVGMLVPLKPSIELVAPSAAKTGQQINLEVTGYNTNYSGSASIRAWLKDEEGNAVLSKNVTVINAQNLVANFDIPGFLPSSDRVVPFTLILDHPVDGAMVSPDAVFITQDSISKVEGQTLWQKDIINDLTLNTAFTFPSMSLIRETIRNTFYHVPLWFAMVIIFGAAVYWSIKYLRNPQSYQYDNRAVGFTSVGILFGILGTVTGALWARFVWGSYWSWDIKQIVTAVALLIYMAYFILRNAIEDDDRKGRVAAVYNIFAFVALIPLIFVVPRMMDSLHPGNGGNPGLGANDLDNSMRMIFYPAIIGWIIIGLWLANVRYRLLDIKYNLMNK
ncbi:MAG: cytochrome c biogenesis protein [Bacteroidia bacterium]|nr:cytochrome c biogenesis protein [Bacteroidia bacterium]